MKSSDNSLYKLSLGIWLSLVLFVTMPIAGIQANKQTLAIWTIPPTENVKQGLVAFEFDSLVIEEGYSSNSHFVAAMDGCDTFTFEISSGLARFANKATLVKMEACGELELPPVFPGPLGDESYINITNQQYKHQLRVATIPQGNISELIKILGDQTRILSSTKHFAMVDEKALAVFAPDLAHTSILQVSNETASPSGLCIRVPWGPGKVNWKFSNPSASGYSVKPENSNSLIWAQAPSQDIDGIYHRNWANCTALKIPDSCTVDVYSNGTIASCCNAAMELLGHRVKWVNTCTPGSPEESWPDAPLR